MGIQQLCLALSCWGRSSIWRLITILPSSTRRTKNAVCRQETAIEIGSRMGPHLDENMQWQLSIQLCSTIKWGRVSREGFDCCNSLIYTNTILQMVKCIRLLDVRRKCIKIFGNVRLTELKYAALSYVWGKSQSLTLSQQPPIWACPPFGHLLIKFFNKIK